MQAPEEAPAQQPAAAAAGAQAGSQSIVLAGQQLERLPAHVWHEALASLDASGNRLAEWPLPGTALPALRTIDLSCNPGIASVPAHAFACCAASMEHLALNGEPPLQGQHSMLTCSVQSSSWVGPAIDPRYQRCMSILAAEARAYNRRHEHTGDM